MSPPFASSSSSPEWCPERQIYTNGHIPSTASVSTLLSTLTSNSSSPLLIFGYGSLCWHPGPSSSTLSHPTVASRRARLVNDDGWRRSWSQRSADHRGTTSFPGLVCTLLNEEEREMLGARWRRRGRDDDDDRPEMRRMSTTLSSMTTTDDDDGCSKTTTTKGSCEGVVYVIPPALIQRCLDELDLREQGGYSRDVVTVTWEEQKNDDESTTTTTTTAYGKALLYRATPSNPAFWKTAYRDWRFAAAVTSVAVGPSGGNDVYLCRLDEFLGSGDGGDDGDDDDTALLARECRRLKNECDSYWYVACGERKWGQLGNIGGDDEEEGEVDELTEGVWIVKKTEGDDDDDDGRGRRRRRRAVGLFAGGGHSALLTEEGRLYLWGWNEHGQLGRTTDGVVETETSNPTGYAPGEALPLSVSNASLGFSHTLVLEKTRRWVYAFGHDNRGQCTGSGDARSSNPESVISSPRLLVDEPCIAISAGVFHSAAVTTDGDCLVFGCPKHAGFGKRISRWTPADGAAIVDVSCGRKHTVCLDSCGRLWTAGDDNYGQRGRKNDENENDANPGLVDGFLGRSSRSRRVLSLSSGWSHTIALVENESNSRVELYGWGRNDKGQLGIVTPTSCVSTPTLLLAGGEINSPDEMF